MDFGTLNSEGGSIFFLTLKKKILFHRVHEGVVGGIYLLYSGMRYTLIPSSSA